jgi:hypothetical protein
MQSKLPIEIAARRQSSSHICTQPRTHAFRRALEAPMLARAVAVTRPALTMIARLAFLHILSGQRPVARFPLVIGVDERIGDLKTTEKQNAQKGVCSL